MESASKPGARAKLIESGTALIRRNGYTATTVDGICAESGVTKGAFFHHFKSKEALAEACLAKWDVMAEAMDLGGDYRGLPDPRARVVACMDFYIRLFSNPKLTRSCLAGVTAQEASESSAVLRCAANRCFENAEARFRALIEDACRGSRRRIDAAGLASLWIAAIQGSLLLSRASGEGAVIRRNLEHVKQYIAALLPVNTKKEKKTHADRGNVSRRI